MERGVNTVRYDYLIKYLNCINPLPDDDYLYKGMVFAEVLKC
jgi:hypothetical protein